MFPPKNAVQKFDAVNAPNKINPTVNCSNCLSTSFGNQVFPRIAPDFWNHSEIK